jgi:hypothetical protein
MRATRVAQKPFNYVVSCTSGYGGFILLLLAVGYGGLGYAY